jgi:hypothetical protein
MGNWFTNGFKEIPQNKVNQNHIYKKHAKGTVKKNNHSWNKCSKNEVPIRYFGLNIKTLETVK